MTSKLPIKPQCNLIDSISSDSSTVQANTKSENMKTIVFVLALVAAVSATRPSITRSDKCGQEHGVTVAMFEAFDPLVSPWDRAAKCYTKCELQEQKVLLGDAFNPAFQAAVTAKQSAAGDMKAGADVMSNCMKGATSNDGCEKAYLFAKCIAGTVVNDVFLRNFVSKFV